MKIRKISRRRSRSPKYAELRTCCAEDGKEMYKDFCYTSQLKYVFRLEENVSRAMGQNSLTPLGEQNSLTPLGTTTWTFDSHVIRSCTLKRRQICVPVGLMSKSHWSRATFLTREGIHYSRKGIYKSAKTYRINKGKNLNILCLQSF